MARTCKEKRVTIVSEPPHLMLRCDVCGKAWLPNLQSGGRLPVRYWLCPDRCNAEE